MTKVDNPIQMHRTAADWLTAIADHAETDIDSVTEVLERYAIEAQPTLPRARKVWIRSIILEGTKKESNSDGPFRFEWTDLGPGLWAVMSEKNFRGKSSILNILRSAIQGSFPGQIKPDVWAWLQCIEVCFSIDATLYRVLIEKPVGATSLESARARLSRKEDNWLDLYDGPSTDGLKVQTSALFMEELGFSKFHAFNKQNESAHSHGWPAISSALFVGESGKAIFGDLLVDALPLRLLQLFMGLPWVTTYTAAQAAVKQVEARSRRRTAESNHTITRLNARIADLEAQAEGIRESLAQCPDRAEFRRKLANQDAKFVQLQSDLVKKRNLLATLNGNLQCARIVFMQSKQVLQQIEDEQAAGYLFRRLRPVCCPACEAGIDAQRYETEGGDTCPLCGNVEHLEANESFDRAAIFRADVADAEARLTQLKEEVFEGKKQVQSTESDLEAVMSAIEANQKVLFYDEDHKLEMTLTEIMGRIDELRELAASQEDEQATEDEQDLPILKATEVVTKQTFDELQRDILSDVSTALAKLAKDFGVENVTEMKLDSAGRLRIRQGGTDTNFSALAPGEKLRVRIAAALAVIEVAKIRGYGRHPGLLVLDSPGAQEMTVEDFVALLANVQTTVAQINDIQIIVGAIARPELTAIVPSTHALLAKGEDSLF
jgi:hypothetical protein